MVLRQPRKRGPKPSTHYRLVRALSEYVRAYPEPMWMLALRCGYPATSPLSALLHGSSVTATPLNLARLRRLAEIVRYTGPLFVEEPEREAAR